MPTVTSRTKNTPPTAMLSRGGLRCLLIGIRGAGMSALAEILGDLGHQIVGADRSITAEELAIHRESRAPLHSNSIVEWNAEALLQQEFDVCVHTPAVRSDDPLMRALANSGAPVITLHEALGAVFADKRQICIAGTHGKTTTSAMLAWILQRASKSPSWFVGGELIDTHSSGSVNHGSEAIIESCEFSSAFEHLSPNVAVLTGIERDHFDRFENEAEEDARFGDFVRKVTPDGHVIVNADCRRAMQAVESFSGITSVSVDSRSNADWIATDVAVKADATLFRIHSPSESSAVCLRVPGRHNVRNATMAIATASQLGVSVDQALAAIEEFRGVRRRFEVRGVANGVTFVDDYGHHPTAIAETLRTARQVFGQRRLVLVFEPHQLSRTQALFSDFVSACELADEMLLLPVFPAREQSTHLECCRLSGRLVRHLNKRNRRAFLFANLDQIVSRIDHSLKPSDVCITMGAGTTNLIYDQLTRRLQRHSVA